METKGKSNEEEKTQRKLPCHIYDGPLLPLLQKTHPQYIDRLIVGNFSHVLPRDYKEWQDRYDNFEVRPDDIFVVTLAKAGTTWTQELVWCVLYGTNDKRGGELLMRRFPFFEWDSLMADIPAEEFQSSIENDPCAPGETWRILHTTKGRRTIKSHLSKELLPRQVWTRKPKIVYVCRDPRDVCVSFYYHTIKYEAFSGTMEEWVELFLGGVTYFTPYWPHVLEFWKMRREENILFIRYEELQQDLPAMIKKVAKFLGKNPSAEDVSLMEDHLSFDKMKDNQTVNQEVVFSRSAKKDEVKFMRKGKVGDWKNHFGEATIQKFKEWTEISLKNSDFPYYRDYE